MGSELVDKPPLLTYGEQFIYHFPYYLSIGMTYDQYWNEDCDLVKYYRKANELNVARKNQELWLQGMYIYEALCDVSPVLHAFAKQGTKPRKYADRPYGITGKDVKQQREADAEENRIKARIAFEAWAAQLDLPKDEVDADVDNRPTTN